eukprot:scaffold446999_cov50-Prasinocladus_malaysianus.AAC.1
MDLTVSQQEPIAVGFSRAIPGLAMGCVNISQTGAIAWQTQGLADVLRRTIIAGPKPPPQVAHMSLPTASMPPSKLPS